MAPTPIIHPLLENGLLYKLSLQPALNNLVNTYLSHEGPLSDLKFDYKDAQPWIQVFILITGLGVGTFLFLRALNAPEEVSRTSVGAARKRTENKVREGANGLAKGMLSVRLGSARFGRRSAVWFCFLLYLDTYLILSC